MENEYANVNLTGFSYRPQNPEFREEIKEKQKSNNKKSIIITLVFLGLFIASLLAMIISIKFLDSTAAAWVVVAAFAGLPIFGIITLIMGIVTIVTSISNSKGLVKDSWDGVVLEKKHWVTTSTDDDGYTTEHDNYLITIQPNEGKKFKMRGMQAKAFLPYVESGDRVRYHPGFPFPMEIYDKSRHLSNVCVFCGARNDARRDTCEKCGKPMLI